MKIQADEDALRHLAKLSDGDARKALNSLEIAALTTAPDADGVIHIDLAVAEQSIQKKAIVYDGDGDAHYDTISAFIKSMRGSDPDAALYWLAKMIHAGEDPRFIARRIVIHAAEDVGLADPMALVLAQRGVPGGGIHRLAGSADSDGRSDDLHRHRATRATAPSWRLTRRWRMCESGRTLAVPEHLRDAHYKGAKRLGHGEGYQYAHDHPEHFVRAGLSRRGQALLRTDRAGRGKEDQGTRGEMARAVCGGETETQAAGGAGVRSNELLRSKLFPCPEGACDNSPAFQRRVTCDVGQVPKGRLRSRDVSSRSFGTYDLTAKVPALKRRAIFKCPFGTGARLKICLVLETKAHP